MNTDVSPSARQVMLMLIDCDQVDLHNVMDGFFQTCPMSQIIISSMKSLINDFFYFSWSGIIRLNIFNKLSVTLSISRPRMSSDELDPDNKKMRQIYQFTLWSEETENSLIECMGTSQPIRAQC